MATRNQWLAGARPRTLPAAVAPVLVGTSLAYWQESIDLGASYFQPAIAILALIVSLALQVGVNYSNDYSDGIRGTDAIRVGPVRLVGQSLAPPKQVKLAAFISYGIGAIAGLLMVLLSHYYLLIPVGIAAILSAWFYTGGKNPYGYAGWGEIFVFTFFGLVAVIGTYAAQTKHISLPSILGAIVCGALSTAILVVNNLRDIPGDTQSGKKTLAVRLGDNRTRVFYYLCIVIAFGAAAYLGQICGGPKIALLVLLPAFVAIKPIAIVKSKAKGPELIPVLAGTSRVLLVLAIALSVAIALSR